MKPFAMDFARSVLVVCVMVGLCGLAINRFMDYLTAEPDWAAIEEDYIDRKRASMLEGAKRRQVAWDERCTAIDCTQFPIGFSTLDIGGSRYYFPLRHIVQQNVPDTGSHTGLGYFNLTDMSNFNNQWKILRSFASSDWKVFGRGYTELFDWYGLLDEEDSANMPTSGFMFLSDGSNRWHEEDHLYAHLETVVPPQLIEDDLTSAVSIASQPFSADFVRVADYVPPNGGYTIVSKVPMHRERHIVGRCRRGGRCDFFTLRQTGDDEMRNPIFNLQQVAVLPTQTLYDCDGHRDGFATSLCPEGEAYFSQIDDLFETIDQLFEAAEIYPEPR